MLHTLAPALDHYGYLAVAGFVLLEDFGVPVPGETILILGAVYAGSGRLSVWLVGLLALLAALTGDNIGFAIGRFGGRLLVERYGRYVLLTPERLGKATGFAQHAGHSVIIIARFVEGLRQANGIIAGTTDMHWARFLAFNAAGALLWVAVWTSVGYFSGSHITSVYDTATRYDLYFAGGVVLVLIGYLTLRLLRRRRARRG